MGAQTNKLGLGSSRKERDMDITKSFIRRDESDGYQLHAMSLKIQNEWVTIGDFCIPLALRWFTLLYDWSPALLKFCHNAFQMTFKDQSSLVRWGKATEKSCNICGEAVGTAKHLLVGCRVLLERGQYSRRHVNVLEIIRKAVNLSVARVQRDIATTKRFIKLIKEGSSKKSKPKPYSILDAADSHDGHL